MTADDTRLAASFIQWDIAAKKQKDLEDEIAAGAAIAPVLEEGEE